MLYLDEELTRESKAFFIGADAPDINQYGELATKRIGVLRGAVYFERFDQDANLVRLSISDYATALRMVFRGRMDAAIIPDLLADY